MVKVGCGEAAEASVAAAAGWLAGWLAGPRRIEPFDLQESIKIREIKKTYWRVKNGSQSWPTGKQRSRTGGGGGGGGRGGGVEGGDEGGAGANEAASGGGRGTGRAGII